MTADEDERHQHHLRELKRCLGKMQDCNLKAAKLHDDLHQVLAEMAQHGTSAGEHFRALTESDDNELTARPTQRKDETEAEYCARMRRWLDIQSRKATANYFKRH
jgi:hypothetical protein